MSINIDGREYEAASYSDAYSDGSRQATLRLVKQQPKYEIKVFSAPHPSENTIEIFWCGGVQAQLIKESINNLMEYLTDKNVWDKGILETLVAEARTAMRENN